MRDAVDDVLDQWAAEAPGLDVSPMAVVGRISRVAAILERRVAEVLAEHGLRPGEFDVLATLRRAGSPHRLPVGALQRSTMVTSGAITHRLDQLEARRLVARHSDPDNRRSVIVSLTEEGHRTVERALVAHVDNEHRLLAGLTPEERALLARLLRTLLVDLGDRRP